MDLINLNGIAWSTQIG